SIPVLSGAIGRVNSLHPAGILRPCRRREAAAATREMRYVRTEEERRWWFGRLDRQLVPDWGMGGCGRRRRPGAFHPTGLDSAGHNGCCAAGGPSTLLSHVP